MDELRGYLASLKGMVSDGLLSEAERGQLHEEAITAHREALARQQTISDERERALTAAVADATRAGRLVHAGYTARGSRNSLVT